MMGDVPKSLRVEKLGVEDIEELGFWRELAGVESENLPGDIAGLMTAHEAGHLGCATGAGSKKNLQRLLQLEFPQWYLSKTAAHALKLNAETIGVVTVGPPHTVWKQLAGNLDIALADNVDQESAGWAIAEFAAVMSAMAKISLIAVRPDHQHRGHGARLMRFVLDLPRRDRVHLVYAQYDSSRTHLAQFYAQHGFRICKPGETLDLTAITGQPIIIGGRTDETFVVREDHLHAKSP
jgi:GNAT superfamily N-acetyltransferase